MTKDIQTHWQAIGPVLTIHNEDEYDLAVERLNTLLDEIGTDEGHPLYNLMDTLGTLVHVYDETHYVIPTSSGVETVALSKSKNYQTRKIHESNSSSRQQTGLARGR